MSSSPPVVLTIAGFDPCSGAGVTADIKTIAAHDCYGVACITAMTVQSTQGVTRFEPVSPETIAETLEALAEDTLIAAVHVGMLGTAHGVRAVVNFLGRRKPPHVVLDPVLRSTSGTPLLDDEGCKVMISRLMPLADVITPNLDEASAITGLPVGNLPEMKAAAAKLHRMGAKAVVLTGGHLTPAVDLLSFPRNPELQPNQETYPNQELFQKEFTGEHQNSISTHGTGCAFSTSLACNLARDQGLVKSVMEAKTYVALAIARGKSIGRGIGPVNHLYRLGER